MSGLIMEGARWDEKTQVRECMVAKESSIVDAAPTAALLENGLTNPSSIMCWHQLVQGTKAHNILECHPAPITCSGYWNFFHGQNGI